MTQPPSVGTWLRPVGTHGYSYQLRVNWWCVERTGGRIVCDVRSEEAGIVSRSHVVSHLRRVRPGIWRYTGPHPWPSSSRETLYYVEHVPQGQSGRLF